uniref:Protein SOSEKI 4 n=1 Tax=Physcomitrium patens TaxID=3218 RepID=A0A7I4BC06_PHYPA
MVLTQVESEGTPQPRMPSLRTERRSFGMETPRHSSFRMAEVLYVLSCGGQLEHPHMINVQYPVHQPGPTLRDVKTRLIALRGRGMPDSFSWSYKRNYKDTFIWCDLFDDNFILPLSESGEYALKATKRFDASQVKYLRPPRRSENLEAEGDVSMVVKKGLVLISDTGSVTSNRTMELNKQLMNSLSHSRSAAAVRNNEHSDVSSSDTHYSYEDVIERKDYPARCKSNSGATKRGKASVTPKQCHPSSRPAYWEFSPQGNRTGREDSLMTIGLTKHVVEENEGPTTPRAPARRRTWKKEIDKITIFRESNNSESSDDEQPSVQAETHVSKLSKSGGSYSAAPEDLFLYILRKATRLGSFKPRVCTEVDVVDSTQSKTKMLFRSKTKDEVNRLLYHSPLKQDQSIKK